MCVGRAGSRICLGVARGNLRYLGGDFGLECAGHLGQRLERSAQGAVELLRLVLGQLSVGWQATAMRRG